MAKKRNLIQLEEGILILFSFLQFPYWWIIYDRIICPLPKNWVMWMSTIIWCKILVIISLNTIMKAVKAFAKFTLFCKIIRECVTYVKLRRNKGQRNSNYLHTYLISSLYFFKDTIYLHYDGNYLHTYSYVITEA